ncbi:DNA repair protein RecO [Catenovulum adriaticum]|uniref:DNA repair protein RecO n=1 Tax=Catenovulum adriaticum TaxID=2984846 RepID=A0ABY7ASA5_9ALTE|nr:DNA repair protein RecO [Catenovulum sp. TS8]WAJ72412.1 DNA repair protein RecO [Catenovulum sp. TS8]
MQQAIVLHAKPHRENSFLCQLLTERDGRITAFARRSKNQAHLTPFNLYLIHTVQGHGELFFIQSSELVKSMDTLKGARLYSGLYINELIAKLLHQVLQPEQCLDWYIRCLQNLLDDTQPIEPSLRCFELDLIDELGLAPDYFHCAITGKPLNPHAYYQFQPDLGWVPNANHFGVASPKLTGEQIQQMATRSWQNGTTLKQSKIFMRWWLDILLMGRPLKSRDLFKYKR